MLAFFIGGYIGGFLVEAATEFVCTPGCSFGQAAFAGAVWPYSIVRSVIKAIRIR